MSEGTDIPAEWTPQPAQPGPGEPPGSPVTPGPPAGGFGPPPASYGPAGAAYPQAPQPYPIHPGPPVPQPYQAQPTPGQQSPGGEHLGGEQPDWSALADRHAVESRRRRRIWAGAAVAAVLVVGGVVTTAMLMNDHHDKGGKVLPSTSASAPAPAGPDALAFISDATTDKAPVDPALLFPDETRSVDGKTWTRKASGTTKPCSKATTGGLGLALGDDVCRSVVRATYVSGDSAVTVGVAVFDTKAAADAALAKRTGQIQGLSGPGVGLFCIASGCDETHASVGRYGYFTVSGTLKQGGAMTDPDAAAAAPSFADAARQQLLARAKQPAAGS
ncbi:hypothetical protein GCM10009665_20560 [Kitasatospora nipponensis]|uniref:Uncharacterized protein n=1 Tax=Kitasatospora nipponensis TaxID=258049 RepID=A0ABN1W0Q9_9ACTN